MKRLPPPLLALAAGFAQRALTPDASPPSAVNAVTRNPMYVGMAGLLVANAVRRGAWAGLLPVAAFVLVIDRLQITAEESALLANFGADYDAYLASVPRWLDRRSLAIGH
ncbi:methyltransferase family protein [Nocardioides terrigena]|uniref:methyltransferase family protein n=1 Tax=Nocardioides terrigena TaxID=424797 RepID=UPI000D304A41|nr:hypothetical protein [Nocardioides terrigena]